MTGGTGAALGRAAIGAIPLWPGPARALPRPPPTGGPGGGGRAGGGGGGSSAGAAAARGVMLRAVSPSRSPGGERGNGGRAGVAAERAGPGPPLAVGRGELRAAGLLPFLSGVACAASAGGALSARALLPPQPPGVLGPQAPLHPAVGDSDAGRDPL